MGNGPVFGRRGSAQAGALPRLADLAPLEPTSDDEDLDAWNQARKQAARETHRRWLYGWGGSATLLMLGSALLRYLDHDLTALPLSLASMFCYYRGYRVWRR